MASTWKTRICCLAALISITNASPLPGSTYINPVVHSLATYATTNSFLYTNKLGTVNYRFTKPQLSQFQPFTKLVGIPFQPSLFSAAGQIYVSSNPSQESENNGLLQTHAASGEPKIISNRISTYLTPPDFGSQFLPYTEVANQNDIIVQNLKKNTLSTNVSSQEKLENTSAEENLKVDSFSAVQDEPAIENSHAETEKQDENSNSELENLFSKVINAPFHKPDSLNNIPDPSSDFPEQLNSNSANVDETPLQSRQDSNLEQPRSFFPAAGTGKLSPQQGIQTQPGPGLQFPPLLSGNHRFAIPSTSQQPGQSPSLLSRLPPFQSPELFPQNNRFPTQPNPVPQMPALNAQLQPQPVPRLPQFLPGNNPAAPSGPEFSSQHQFSPPSQSQPHLQYPQVNGAGGGAGASPEPENGYNPFHLHERFPEPPYESEFRNDPPEEIDSIEQSQQRSAGSNNMHIPQSLDFAQSTLRNVKTEELLQVVKRKPVPPECVYNTVSYGAGGEDCVEAKKK